MERGDTGLGRDAYGPPRRERDRRGYDPGPYPAEDGYARADYEIDDAAGPGRPVDVGEDDYGQLLRRPGEIPPRQRLRQPGRPYPGQPGRFPPGAPQNGAPASTGPPDGGPSYGGIPGNGAPHGAMPHAGAPHGGAPHGRAPHTGPSAGGPMPNGERMPNAAPPGGGPGSGRQYRLPNGRRVPSNTDRLYGPPGPSMPGGTSGRHHGPGPAAQAPYAGNRSRPAPVPGAPPTGPGPAGAVSGGLGGAVPGGPGGHGPGSPFPGGTATGGPAAGPTHGSPQAHAGPGASSGPVVPPLREQARAGPRYDGPNGRERLGPAPEPPGPVIRQREAGRPDQPAGSAQPIASIAPDGLEAFARDLRALRAQADLDYPQMAEVSHYEMKTLASAAGGLRLPTLPVAVAFVRACDGNVADWEERWQKLAEKITADAARKRKNDGDAAAEPIEPSDAPAALEPPARQAATPPPDSDGGEVYVITSAKPRQPGW